MGDLYKQIEIWQDRPFYKEFKKATEQAYTLSKKMSKSITRKPYEPIEWLEGIFMELKNNEKSTLKEEEKSKLIEETKEKINNLLKYEEKRLKRNITNKF